MKPIKGLDGPEQPRETSKVAQAIGAGAIKLVEWVASGGAYMLACMLIAWWVMLALDIMHDSVPTVPPFGFMFLWAAIWGSGILAMFAGTLVKMVMGDDE